MGREQERIKKQIEKNPVADRLYASETVMNICRENGWEFMIRYKTGSIPSIREEYEAIPEKETGRETLPMRAVGIVRR